MPEQVATIAADKLSDLTGFSEAELRTLARKGYFPKAAATGYQLTPALKGCFKFRKEQVEGSGNLPIYDSMAQAASRTGIPVAVLKQAKKSGCDAFKWNRVSLTPLLIWLFNRDGDDEDWGNYLKRFQGLREEIKYNREHEEILDKAEVGLALKKVMAILFAGLDKHADQLPAILHGLDAVGIKTKITEVNASMRAQIVGGLSALLEKPKSNVKKRGQ